MYRRPVPHHLVAAFRHRSHLVAQRVLQAPSRPRYLHLRVFHRRRVSRRQLVHRRARHRRHLLVRASHLRVANLQARRNHRPSVLQPVSLRHRQRLRA